MDDDIDRHLQAPQEANRDKHINFTAIERGDPDPSLEEVPADETSKDNKRQEIKDDKRQETTGKTPEEKGKPKDEIKGNAGIREDDETK